MGLPWSAILFKSTRVGHLLHSEIVTECYPLRPATGSLRQTQHVGKPLTGPPAHLIRINEQEGCRREGMYKA